MIKKLFLILILSTNVYPVTQIVRYIDPDATGTGDGQSWTNAYTSRATAENAEDCNLIAIDSYITFNCRSSSGTNDTASVAIFGWDTDPNHYIEFVGSDFPADGVWDDSKYVAEDGFGIYDDYVRFRNLQILCNATGTDEATGIAISDITSGTNRIVVDSCIIKNVSTSSGDQRGIMIGDGNTNLEVYNSIIYCDGNNTDNDSIGIWAAQGSGSVANIYNTVVYGWDYGLYRSNGTLTAKNCVSGNNGDDAYGANLTYCCTDDTESGTGNIHPLSGSFANEFTDIAGLDFSLKSDANCVDAGTDNPSSGLYLDDIIGTSRSSPWDIGAFEYASSPASTPRKRPRIININMN